MHNLKNAVVLILLLIGITALSLICLQPVKAQTQNNITINADGSVTPSTAPIQQSGNIYTLTSNVNEIISIKRDNCILDGNGHTINGEISVGYSPNAPTAGISYTSNVTVINFAVKGNAPNSAFGIEINSASNVIIANNTISGTGNGLFSMDAQTAGIYAEGGGSNVITGNTLINNYNGLSFLNSENNLIVGNNITYSTNPAIGDGIGIAFWGSNNTIYHNNFINNPSQAYNGNFAPPFYNNVWDDGYLFGGNYWSDYQTKYPNASEIGNSGIGDTSYIIDSQNKDHYPLMKPFNAATYLLQTTLPKISLLSPLEHVYNGSSVAFGYSSDKPAVWAGYSLDSQQNITITGNDTIPNLTNGKHNLTVYANDTFGNMGASQTISFTVALPEAETFPTVPVAVASGVMAALVIGLGSIAYLKKRH